MDLIVDTNILISAIITPESTITDILHNSENTFYAPRFLVEEIDLKKEKILKITGINSNELDVLVNFFTKKVFILNHHLIEEKYKRVAFDLVSEVDKKDFPFVALAIQKDCTLWTGDKKLAKGLKSKGFKQVISTNEIIQLSKKH